MDYKILTLQLKNLCASDFEVSTSDLNLTQLYNPKFELEYIKIYQAISKSRQLILEVKLSKNIVIDFNYISNYAFNSEVCKILRKLKRDNTVIENIECFLKKEKL